MTYHNRNHQLFSAILLSLILLLSTNTFACANTIVVESNDSTSSDKQLIDWLRSNGATINEKLEIRHINPDDSTSPKGVFATENIDVGEVICEIPMDLMIHPEGKQDWTSTDCGTIEATYKAMTAEENVMNPYVKHLLSQPKDYLPIFWSKEGFDFLVLMLGFFLPPHACDIDEILQPNLCEAPYNDVEDPMMRHARMLVIARSDYAYMIPFYDMFNHKSKRYHIHHEISYYNIQEEQRAKLVAQRSVQAGEEIYNSYNQCDECESKEYMGTAEILMTYGFVESIPQIWFLYYGRLKFELDWKDEDESTNELVVNFLVTPSKRGLSWLRAELKRLLEFEDLNRKNFGASIPESEWNTIWRYYDAMVLAFTKALESATETSEKVWEPSDAHWYVTGDGKAWDEPIVDVDFEKMAQYLGKYGFSDEL
mmetsp:Transcript_7573/g.8672  ORF Transcript_7573/g.8672 Transcript_7573/m.8672 type:complete len:425 (+) Transcript_7573:126-1400(+)